MALRQQANRIDRVRTVEGDLESAHAARHQRLGHLRDRVALEPAPDRDDTRRMDLLRNRRPAFR
jgi:hypothetical protein